jgi:hypothetical protein
MTQRSVFVLHHSYELDGCDETKMIGVYSSREAAEATIVRFRNLPGFGDKPEGFNIDEYLLDEDNWTEGFITMKPD